MNYWLMKTEPQTFSITDLEHSENQTSHWEGVRNYQARNFMRDEMKKGDTVLIYHSSCKSIGVSGIAQITNESYPDHTALDPQSPYFDSKSTKEEPRWFMVDLQWRKTLSRTITLKEMKDYKELENMVLFKRKRLSIIPITELEYDFILTLE